MAWKLVAAGLGGDRLGMRTVTRAEFLSVWHEVDISLDTLPWSGATTSCEALWMGVPVLTLLGNRHAGRVTASFLNALGLHEWITATPDAFVEQAVRAASDLPGLSALRGRLRDAMRSSALCDAAAFVQDLEAAYRTMWRRWCSSQRQN